MLRLDRAVRSLEPIEDRCQSNALKGEDECRTSRRAMMNWKSPWQGLGEDRGAQSHDAHEPQEIEREKTRSGQLIDIRTSINCFGRSCDAWTLKAVTLTPDGLVSPLVASSRL